jgi:hypothetical protein
MNQIQTADSIEAEAARVRAQLVEVGADLRSHVDPVALVDVAKASFTRRSEGVPPFLKKNASPIGLVLLGGAFGATLIGLLSPPRKKDLPATGAVDPPGTDAVASPTAKAHLGAVLLSTVSVGLGYVGGMFVPKTTAEERLLGEPKAVLSAKLDEFLQQHSRGMKLAAANLFGVSRISAAMLVALAAAAEALGVSRPSVRIIERKPL